ncbi:MAG: hypothetical protein HOV87_30760 [Catenulispora sp.]|nr:hypothetical protein [Catenulispora sp.]
MSTQFATPIARLDYRVRIAAALLRSAPLGERLAVVGTVLMSAAAAWPLGGPLVVVPALLALAALIRHHLDGLEGRRDALEAAGANPADTRVISSAGPLGATGLGALVGIVAAIVLGRSLTHALAPLAVGIVATLLIRRGPLGAPALAAGSLAALVTAAVVRANAGTPAGQPRSRLVAGQSAQAAHATTSAWSAAWPPLLAAVLVVAATQAAITHRDTLRQLGRRLADAVHRRLIARSGA